MCQRITCSTCAKPSYAGCGRHIEAVLGDVKPADRCRCREEKAARPAAKSNSGPGLFSFFRRSGGQS